MVRIAVLFDEATATVRGAPGGLAALPEIIRNIHCRWACRDDVGPDAVPDVTGITALALRAAHALAIRWPQQVVLKQPTREFSMSKFAIGEQVDNAADNHEGGTIIAIFPTVEGNFRYAVDTEGYGTLKFFNEEKLVRHLH